MIVYRDKCYCLAEHCKHYQKCKDAFPYARKEQAECNRVADRLLPIDVCDMSKMCKEYARGEKET